MPLAIAASTTCSSHIRSPPLRVPHQERPHHAGGHGHAAHDRHAHEPLLGDLVVDELPQVRRLQVRRLRLEELVVVPPRLGVVAQLVVAEGQVVEALAAAFRGGTEDLGEELDAELLVVAGVGLDEALGRVLVGAALSSLEGHGGVHTQA